MTRPCACWPDYSTPDAPSLDRNPECPRHAATPCAVSVLANPGCAYVLTCRCGWTACVEHGGIWAAQQEAAWHCEASGVPLVRGLSGDAEGLPYSSPGRTLLAHEPDGAHCGVVEDCTGLDDGSSGCGGVRYRTPDSLLVARRVEDPACSPKVVVQGFAETDLRSGHASTLVDNAQGCQPWLMTATSDSYRTGSADA